MVKGRFSINDELRLLIYITASTSLSALTFSHPICRLEVIQNLEPSLSWMIKLRSWNFNISLIFSLVGNAALHTLITFFLLTFNNWQLHLLWWAYKWGNTNKISYSSFSVYSKVYNLGILVKTMNVTFKNLLLNISKKQNTWTGINKVL